MKSLGDARKLAQSLVDTAEQLGMKTTALLTDMNEPLGEYVGNSVEVLESIDMLQGKKVEQRFYQVTLQLAEEMCRSAFPDDKVNWRERLQARLSDGTAYDRFLGIIQAQGAKVNAIDNLPDSLPLADKLLEIIAGRNGYLISVDTYRIGRLMVELKAGRMKITDSIDFGVGLRLFKHVGDALETGDAIAELITRDKVETAEFARCFTISDEPARKEDVVRERIPA